jgi:hypothetical protein
MLNTCLGTDASGVKHSGINANGHDRLVNRLTPHVNTQRNHCAIVEYATSLCAFTYIVR